MSKWKFFNFRPLFFVFTILVVSIFSANFVHGKIYLSITTIIATLILLALYCFKFKKFIVFIVGIVTIFIGFSSFYLQKTKFNSGDLDFVNNPVSGVIDSVSRSSYGREMVITNVKLNNKDVKVNCYVSLLQKEVLEDYNVGDLVVFIVKESVKVDFYNDEVPNASSIKRNIKYQLTTDAIEVSASEQSLKIKLQQRIKSNLEKGLDNDKANLMYSSLFGDKTDLNYMIKESFSASGVAHLLAVSGLHVGLIVGILMIILKLCKCNKYIKILVVSLFLLFYCYLCGWSASIVRASIMSVILIGAPLLFSEYDTLSSISLAGIIILCFNPCALFDVSFLLSFMCVFGITMFYQYLNKLLTKIHFNNALSQILAISIITNISTLFVMIYYFNEVSFIGILANILILPLFTFVFTIVFVVIMISLIVSYASSVLLMINPIINLVTVLSNWFASVSVGIVPVKISFASVILYSVVLFFLSKYNLKSPTVKFIAANILILVLIAQILLNLKVFGI